MLPEETPVKDYLGSIKVLANDITLAAVVNYDIRGKKSEQSMDIILRFWAENFVFATKIKRDCLLSAGQFPVKME